ncbi:MAG: DUF6531 domain-containing protein [Myxococcota bacterium]
MARWWWVAVAVIGVGGGGCSENEQSTGKAVVAKRSALEDPFGLLNANESNLKTRAIATTKLSSQVVIIPRSAWDLALRFDTNGNPRQNDLGFYQGTTVLRQEAARIASIANDPVSSGVVAIDEEAPGQFHPSDILVVVNDPARDPASRRIIASDYFIAAVGLDGNAPWMVRGGEIAIEPLSSGGGRCCGPEVVGEQVSPSGPFPGFTPPTCTPSSNSMCDFGLLRVGGALRTEAARTSVGRPPIHMVSFSANGDEIRFAFAGLLGGIAEAGLGCAYARPICLDDPATPGGLFGGWEGELPHGNPNCAPSTSVSGTNVPPICTIAGGAGLTAAGGGVAVIRGAGLTPAMCDGQCPECSSLSGVTNTDVIPRQCWVKNLPGDICEKNTWADVEAYQRDVNLHFDYDQMLPCGDPKDLTARCGGCKPIAGGQFQECGRCTKGRNGVVSCQWQMLPVADPRADGEGGLGVSTRTKGDLATLADEKAGVWSRAGYSPPPTLTTISLLPEIPCTAGCNRTARAAEYPSGAPRPSGGSAQTAGGSGGSGGSGGGPSTGGSGGGAPTGGGGGGGPDVNQNDQDPANNSQKSVTQDPKGAGDPVSLFDGALTLDTSDLSFPGPVRPLVFRRSYSSRSDARGALGSNWTHNFEIRLVPLKKQNLPSWVDPYCMGTSGITTCVMLVSGDSSRIFYLDQATGMFMPPAGTMATIRQAIADPATNPDDAGWILRQPDGSQLQFDRYGYMTADVDRFGNGFTLSYENTAAGIVAEHVCPDVPYVLGAGGYAPMFGPTGVSSGQQGCVLLYGLTGITEMPKYSKDTVVTDAMFGTPSTDPAVAAARAAVVASQPRFGTPLPSGQAFRRLTRVKDNLGRELTFDYFTAGTNIGLLQRVRGPAGAAVEFSYSANPNALDGLNERFLASARRVDGATNSPLLSPSGQRGYEYEYAWQVAGRMPTDLAAAEAAYRDYFKNIYNCGTLTKAPCSDKWVSTVQFADLDALTAERMRRHYADAADNILTVRVFDYVSHTSKIESETRYGQNIYDVNFDRALAQRWGATADPSLPSAGLPASTFSWNSSLPLAVFEYQGAEPVTSNAQLVGDKTTTFLPAELAARYPLETEVFNANHQAGDVGPVQMSYNKGYLLPRNSPDSIPFGTRPLAALGSLEVRESSSREACGIEKLPKFRSHLPDYQPTIDYYDVALPTADLATPGVSYTQPLRRTYLSCTTLALSETYDVTHNDLASTWSNALDGGYVVETVTVRRKYTAANANRICEWAKYVDRDGDVHYSGLNFQGRPLVEAVRVPGSGPSQWKVAETLYNADGNVVAQRRTTEGNRAWTPNDGDTRYLYHEEPVLRGSLGTTRPLHWNKRGNVIRVWERPRGSSVWDETQGTDTQLESHGRFSAYAYEPFYNQLRLAVRGNVKADNTDEVLERTVFLADFQELGPDSPELQSLLWTAHLWGAVFPVPTSPDGGAPPPIDWNTINTRVGIELLDRDLNGDGERTGVRGTPVLVRRMDGAQTQVEDTLIRWSPSGRPYLIDEPGGGRTLLRYYSIGGAQTGLADASPTGAANGGNYGFLASVSRSREWPASAGPARSSCNKLPSQYRFLLTSCGNDPAAGLAALGLPSEVVDGIVNAPSESTTTFNYNPLGHVSAVRSAVGTRTVSKTDTDGRLTRSELFEAGGATPLQETEYVRDGFMRVTTERRTAGGVSLGDTIRTYDNDDRVLTECHEARTGGCNPGRTDGIRQTWVYTREGHVYRNIDAMGLVAQYERDGRKWVTTEKLISPDPADPVRQTRTYFDNDGNVERRVYGRQSPLEETMTRDGFGRLLTSIDPQQRTREYRYTKRDQMSSELLVGDTAGKTRYLYDALGRATAVTKNGIGLAEYDRLPGGLVFAQSATGRGKRFLTFDANGQPAWSENSVGDQSVFTELVSPAHLVTQSRIRQGGVKTTSSIALLNALGLPDYTVEKGGGLQRKTTYQRDAAGNVVRTEAADSAITEADYDFLGRVTELREQNRWGTSNFEVSTYSYNARGQLDTVIDPAKYVTVQTYDGFGAPQTKTIPASSPIQSRWEYDDLGRKTRHLVNQNVDLGYEYNDRGQLHQIVQGPPDTGAKVLAKFEWDALGRLFQGTRTNLGAAPVLAEADRQVVTTRTYDDLSRIYTEETRVGQHPARTITSQWTVGAQWTREVTLPSGRRQVHLFDTEGRLAELERVSGLRTDYAWVDDLLVGETSATNGARLERTTEFDDLAQPIHWSANLNKAVLDVSVVRDIVGRIASSSISFFPSGNQIDSWRGYVYDATGRLGAVHESSVAPSMTINAHAQTPAMGQQVDAAGASVGALRWAYEREKVVGSVLKISDGIHTPRFETSARYQTPGGAATARLPGYQLDKYSVGNASRQASHDSAGRVVADGDQQYVFDDLDALAAVNDDSGKTREVYLYDVAGRLAARLDDVGALVEQLVTDDSQMVESFDGKGTVQWSATWGPGVDNLVSVRTDADEYFALGDGKASIVGWVGSKSETLEVFAEYTPEGLAKFSDRNGGSCEESNGLRCSRPFGIPFAFHSAYSSSTTGLLYFRNRWYAPESAQWLAQDPLGAIDSFNLYSFNREDTVNFFDPEGLDAKELSGKHETIVREKRNPRVPSSPVAPQPPPSPPAPPSEPTPEPPTDEPRSHGPDDRLDRAEQALRDFDRHVNPTLLHGSVFKGLWIGWNRVHENNYRAHLRSCVQSRVCSVMDLAERLQPGEQLQPADDNPTIIDNIAAINSIIDQADAALANGDVEEAAALTYEALIGGISIGYQARGIVGSIKPVSPAKPGITIQLKRPSGVSDAAWNGKMKALNDAAARGQAKVVHRPVRDGAAQRQARQSGSIAPGDHADHALDLQFGGADDIDNIRSTDARVNTSVGGQGQQRLAHPDGTPISGFVEKK